MDLSTGTITVDGLNDLSGQPVLVLVEFPFDTILAGALGVGSMTLRSSTQMIIFGLDLPS